ncbi:hypothetical protein ID866_12124 [Astraeus odoratus]|nr:hypothetical protein ID866_12124 [Astraeus odoratus]
MSTCKSSMTTGTPAVKVVNWTKVPDEELATDIDDMDSRYRGQRKCIKRQRSENRSARWKRQKNAGKKRRRGNREKQRQSRSRKLRRLDEPLLQRPENGSGLIQRPRQVEAGIPAGIKKRLACGLCAKAKERCKWPEVEMMVSRAGMSPQGRECKKQVKKVADEDNDDEIIVLSSWKTKQQGGVSTHMDIANGHLEKIAITAQSNRQKMQCHYMLMEGLVGQQQVLLSKLVEIMSTAGSGGSKEVIEDQEELKELQGEELGGQEGDTEGVPGGAPEGEPEDVPGNELEDGAGVEGQQSQAKGKGKEKAL